MVNLWLCEATVSKFVNKTDENLRLRGPSKTIPKFREWFKTFQDQRFLRNHSNYPALLAWNSLSNTEDFYVTFITRISLARVMITARNRTYLQLKVKIHLHRIMHALSSSNLARSHQMHPRTSLLAWERIQENYLLLK